MFFKFILACFGLAVMAAAGADEIRAQDFNRDAFKLRYSPKIRYYDSKKDKFVYIDSVLNPVRKDNPGQDLGYYGNRLTQYRFIGPRERAGIYGAIDGYNSKMDFDAEKYPYRWR